MDNLWSVKVNTGIAIGSLASLIGLFLWGGLPVAEFSDLFKWVYGISVGGGAVAGLSYVASAKIADNKVAKELELKTLVNKELENRILYEQRVVDRLRQ